MTAAEYRHILKTLGLNQREAGEFLGVSLPQSSRYARGFPVPLAIIRLLRIMARMQWSRSQVEKLTHKPIRMHNTEGDAV